jgi:hypothetical protein
VKAKAYPGLKELAVARAMGAQGIVASICPKQLSDPGAADYGYRPAGATIVSAVAPVFRQPCMATALATDANKQTACVLVAAADERRATRTVGGRPSPRRTSTSSTR